MDIRDKSISKKAKVCSDVLRTRFAYLYNTFRGRETDPFRSPINTGGCHCTLLRSAKGSMTVEASLVTPVFFIVMFSLFYLLQIISGVMQMQGQLRDAAKEYACHGTKFQTVKTLIDEKKVICWKGKNDSDGTESDELCYVDYMVRVPFLGEKFFAVHLYQQMAVSKYEGQSMVPAEETDEEYVYITLTGKVCHKDALCTYLKPSIRTVLPTEVGNKRNASGGKYYACESCCKGKSADDFNEVLITSYGDCFHCKRECPGLKRTVRKVKKSETGLPYCSKCG